jgi:uncharacterized integral membrane protein
MSQNDAQKKSGNTFVLVVWGVIAVLLLVFVANNTQSIELSIAFTEVSMPLWLLVVIIFALGLAAGWVTKWWTGRR